MKENVKDYLQKEFVKRDMKVNLRNCNESDLFYYLVYFKEGLALPDYMVSIFMKYAKEILDVNDVIKRIGELKTGDINFSDFLTCEEMAEYLENGDKL